jgi:anthranilate synthase component 1
MIYPTKEEFLDLKRNSASYIPVKLEMNADLMTPIGLFYSLKGEKKFLLESAECGKSWGRYSLLGFTPYLTIKSYGEEVWVGDRKFIGSVLDVLKEVMGRYEVSETKHGLPFFGGAVGYVGYDVARQYLNIKSNNKDDLNLPDAYLMLYKEVLVYDHFTHR